MNEYARRVASISGETARREGRRPRFFIRTYGCQMNVRESEKLAGVFALMGYARAEGETEADVILYNTCCVRESAENKILGNLSYLKYYKQSNPSLIVALCGCMTEQRHMFDEITGRHAYVDIVFGTRNHEKFPELLLKRLETGRPAADVGDLPVSGPDCPEALVSRGHKYKAGVSVMRGCDNFCSYCIVPYVRGREQSRPPGDILNEITALAGDGVREIMLLGQNVNTYGKGLEPPADFASILRRADAVGGLSRIRFLTSHPRDFPDALIAAVGECKKVCGHIHLPLQSGSTGVLESMNRRYTKEQYLELAERIRAVIPDVALSTDIIVGFPGETEADFEETLDVIRRVRFSGVFTFLYSKRAGTPAAERTDAVPERVAAGRFKRLNAVINPMLLARNESFTGAVLDVMAEDAPLSKNGTYTGRAGDNTLVHFNPGNRIITPGDIYQVRVTAAKTFYVTGEI